MKFEDLKEGLHSPPTRIKMKTSEVYMDSLWEGVVYHEVIYVNKAKKELVFQAFSKIYLMTAEQFDTRGYERGSTK